MRVRSGGPSARGEAQKVPRWAQLSALLYLISTWLLMVEVLRLPALRKSERPAGPRRVDTRGRTTGPPEGPVADGDTPRARPPRSDDAAFRAGVETAFDVIGVLRELVNEALLSLREEGASAKSANGHRRRPDQGPQ